MSHGCSGGSGSCSGGTGSSGGGGAQYGGGKKPPLWAVVSFLAFHLAVFALVAYGVAVPDNCPCAWTFSNGLCSTAIAAVHFLYQLDLTVR